MLTRRGRRGLALGGGLYVVGWAFGSQAVYPAAVGLVLAVGLAWLWVRLLARPMELRRPAWGGEHHEGDDVSVVLELLPHGRVAPRSLVVVERLGGLGTFEALLARSGPVLSGRYVARRVPRGRYQCEHAHAIVDDPFGLARTEVPLAASGALVVYPRLVELDGLFSESGQRAQDGRQLLLRRPSGFDLHSVRDYEQGESLRKVHWRSTARRGRLMVKELEDAPRDEVAVLLDAAAGVVAGAPPESSFDAQVRAAGSILRAHARHGRRTALIVNSADRPTQSLRGEEGEWRRTLELLAAVQPTGTAPAAAVLADGPAASALDLTVVTAQLTPALVNRLIQRALARRSVSVVYVDAPSFGPAPVVGREPALLKLQAAGVAVAVVRRGDDLRERLGVGRMEARAG